MNNLLNFTTRTLTGTNSSAFTYLPLQRNHFITITHEPLHLT